MSQTWQDACREAQAQCAEYHMQIAQLRADLDAAIAGGADIVAQRDTALGLCGQRERELATVTAERDDYRRWNSEERAAHAETRKALEAKHCVPECSTRAELAKAEARVEELKLLLWRWNADVANTSPVRADSELARETREALRG